MYSHFTFLSVCHLMTCYDDRFGSSHKRSDCRHLLLFHGIQLLTAVSSDKAAGVDNATIPAPAPHFFLYDFAFTFR